MTLPYLTLPNLTLLLSYFHITVPYLILSFPILSHLMSSYLILLYIALHKALRYMPYATCWIYAHICNSRFHIESWSKSLPAMKAVPLLSSRIRACQRLANDRNRSSGPKEKRACHIWPSPDLGSSKDSAFGPAKADRIHKDRVYALAIWLRFFCMMRNTIGSCNPSCES